MHLLENDLIRFAVGECGRTFELGFIGEQPAVRGEHGLFDMLVGAGGRHEWAVDPAAQSGSVDVRDGVLRVRYPCIQHAGTGHDLSVELLFNLEADRVVCEAALENRSGLCVEEFWFPWVGPLHSLAQIPEEDVLIRPDGFGQRIPNPITHVAGLHTGYMAPDQVRILDCGFYPGGWMSMPWFGLYGGGRALSLFSFDSTFQTTGLLLSRDTPTGRLSLGFARYPFLKAGAWRSPRSAVRLHRDDWHSDARLYRQWVNGAWWSQSPRPAWVDAMHGWQRIIMKHQYGEVFYRYDDLVECFEAGRRFGIDALLVFGWFRGGHDAGYPEYEPDEELGGEERLREAIREIQGRGGRVLLYANGHLIDMDSAYYRELGHRISLKTSQGSEYREQYKFAGDGTYLRQFGARSFAAACQSTPEWQRRLIEIGERMAGLGADAIFYDQMGGNTPYLCFDPAHPHDGPALAQGPGKDRNLAEIRRQVVAPRPGLGFGTELVSDCLVRHVDFVHTCTYGMSPGPRVFPEMFLYTFPEILLSSREIRDERDHVRRLHWAFLHGWRIDVEIWRCRGDLSDAPNYGAYLAKLVALRERWPEVLMAGRFIDEDEFTNPNPALRVKGFTGGGRLAIIGWNDTGEVQPFAPEPAPGWRFLAGATPDGDLKPEDLLPAQGLGVLVYVSTQQAGGG